MPESSIFQVSVLLPEPSERAMQRWADKTIGASWPSWGGHITLASSFTTNLGVGPLRDRLTKVCRAFPAFDVCFTQPVALPDVTRRDQFAVFLAPENVEDPGCESLEALQRDVSDALDALKVEYRSKAARNDFYPHVTLALGVSEAEANSIVRSIKSDPLRIEFRVERIWLLAFDRSNGVLEVESQWAFALADP